MQVNPGQEEKEAGVQMMSFSEALISMRNGFAVYRYGWNGLHILAIRAPDVHSKMNKPYIYITTEQGDVLPWVASQADILANDWQTATGRVVEPYGARA
jgi:hypothetical protein